jgi:hypothetical protein
MECHNQNVRREEDVVLFYPTQASASVGALFLSMFALTVGFRCRVPHESWPRSPSGLFLGPEHAGTWGVECSTRFAHSAGLDRSSKRVSGNPGGVGAGVSLSSHSISQERTFKPRVESVAIRSLVAWIIAKSSIPAEAREFDPLLLRVSLITKDRDVL